MFTKEKIDFNQCVDIYELNKNDFQLLADKKKYKRIK